MIILTIQNKIQRKKKIQLLAGLFVSVLTIVTLQDLLHARRNQYNFYLSESFLFNSYWLWFYPIIYITRIFLKSKKILPIHTKRWIQISYFILSASALHAMAYILTVFVISYFFYQGTYDISKMFGYTLSHDFYKYIFIYGLAGMVFIRTDHLIHKEALSPPVPEEKKPKAIVVGNSRNNEIIPITDITIIKSASPYIALYTHKKVHLHTETLKSILEKLPSSQFVQVHKSTIINIRKVVSYKSRLNGDYDVLLDDGQNIRLSRNYTMHFKKSLVADSSS